MTEKSAPQKGKMPGPIDMPKRTPGEGKPHGPVDKKPNVKIPRQKPTVRKTPNG